MLPAKFAKIEIITGLFFIIHSKSEVRNFQVNKTETPYNSLPFFARGFYQFQEWRINAVLL
jgi:hypothetical protein